MRYHVFLHFVSTEQAMLIIGESLYGKYIT